MKRLIIIVGILMVCLSSAFAQTTGNVEKAVRFRAQQKDVTVEVKNETIEQKSETPISSVETFSMKLHSSNQLKELGPRYKWWNAAQLQELGLRDAHRWVNCWSLPNATQLKELGPRYKPVWNAAQLKELGPRYKWWNTTQLHELGGNTHRGWCF